MHERDFYINLKKPTLGVYVKEGAGLTDLAGHITGSSKGTCEERTDT